MSHAENSQWVSLQGLIALALHCPDLSSLRIHFQVDSLITPPARSTPYTVPSADCSLTHLIVGKVRVPEESVLTVALNLLRIFPRMDHFRPVDEGWKKVLDAIRLSKRTVDDSSEQHLNTS